MGYIPVFTVWKYLVSRLYQREDLKLKSAKISVQGPFNSLRMRFKKKKKRSNVTPISRIKQNCESRVVSFRWMEIPDQNMIIHLNLSVATISCFFVVVFLMLIDHTLDLPPPPPFSPCSISLPQKKEKMKNCFKIPTSTGIVVAHVIIANTPSKFFRLHLGTNFLSLDWDLLVVSFSDLFLISSPPPHPSSSDAPF